MALVIVGDALDIAKPHGQHQLCALQYMAELARAPALTWCDVAAPGDWASFALQDPLALCDIQEAARQPHRPRLLSPRFHAALTPLIYGRLRHNKRQIHMQYLRAAQRPVAYDYFAITAGPLSLAQRFASSSDAS